MIHTSHVSHEITSWSFAQNIFTFAGLRIQKQIWRPRMIVRTCGKSGMWFGDMRIQSFEKLVLKVILKAKRNELIVNKTMKLMFSVIIILFIKKFRKNPGKMQEKWKCIKKRAHELLINKIYIFSIVYCFCVQFCWNSKKSGKIPGKSGRNEVDVLWSLAWL
jgi:hypothetical protein